MAIKLVISPAAQADLLDMLDYIARDSPARALAFIADLEHRARDKLALFPDSGRVFKHKLRFIVIDRHVVVYEFDEDAGVVAIHHIHGPGEDWRKD